MLRNLLTVFSRNKTSFFMNLIGLSVAFTVLTVIAIQVKYDLSFDRSYGDVDRIYKIEYYDNAASKYSDYMTNLYIEAIGNEIPGIESYCFLAAWGRNTLKVQDESGELREYTELFWRTSPGFIDVFSLEILEGDTTNWLATNNKIALPQKIAKKFFPNGDALGNTVMAGNNPLTVSLIYKDLPENSTIKNAVLGLYDNKDWSEWSCNGYFKLLPHVNPSIVEETIGTTSVGGMSKDNEDYYKERLRIELTPMKDLYFHSKVTNPRSETGNFNTTLALIAIGILVIGIAYINFINFSTALAPLRIKRINTQKVMGAMPSQLRRNIVWESIVISVLAFFFSLIWTKLFITTPMADFFTANLFLGNNIIILIILGVFAILMGILAGIYPAYYMTSHPPALVLKGSFALTPKGIKLRNSLLFFQFITTIVLITLAVFIKMQHSFMQSMNPGYDRENVVYIGLNGNINKQRGAFVNELMTWPDITDNTFSRFLPGEVGMGWGRKFEGKQVQFSAWPVHHNFLRFFNMRLIEGEDFYEHNEAGVNKIIFNQKFVEQFEFEDIIGKEMGSFRNSGSVVGIVENINFNSVKTPVEPMAFICGDDQWDEYILLKINGTGIPATMEHIKNVGKQFTSHELNVGFLDERMAELYQKEENYAKLISVFGFITILISLMGIYGLIVFNSRFKMKEIGIRKVNGATEGEMLIFLNKSFFILILFSFIIAVPIAWYFITQWLSAFPYRTPVYWWVFILAGITVLIITLITVSYQSWKAATVNPVNTLRNE